MEGNIFEYKGFYGSVEYSLEDGCFFGKLLGISDLVTFEGDNIELLRKGFHEMVDKYIVHCEEYGKTPLKKYDGTLSVIIPPELHERAALRASKQGISLNDFVQKAITDELYLRS